MPNIIGSAKDSKGVPMPGVSMILVSLVPVPQPPQFGLTDSSGAFIFQNPPNGNYKITAVHGNLNYVFEQVFTHPLTANQDSVVDFSINGVKPLPARDNRFLALKYAQYIFLGLIGWFFFYYLIWDAICSLRLKELDQIGVARGAITYLVAVTTIGMAGTLMLAAIMTGGKDLDKRFTLGKEILTLLIGILGTIIGFYYGSSDKAETNGKPNDNPDTTGIQIKNIKFSLNPIQKGKPFTLSANLTGGIQPYIYSIKFTPDSLIDPIIDKTSIDGKINETFNVKDTESAQVGIQVDYIIEGKDKNNKIYNNKGHIKLNK